jgi:hypothetical protein
MASETDNSESPIALENPLSNSQSAIQWVQSLELGYDEPEPPTPLCFCCGKKQTTEETMKLSKCSKCEVAAYCSRDCQLKDWKEGRHKLACPSYARLAANDVPTDETKEAIRNEIFARIRFYACPYAVFKSRELGKGFLFVQSDTTLKDLSICIPKDNTGRTMTTRAILMHFLTLGEYDSELCRDDFEIALVRGKLQELLDTYDDEKEVILLFRLRCGHVALGKAVLVPDYGICKKLGEDYYANNPAGAIQLNLDDL